LWGRPSSVVVKDLRLKDEDKDKESSFKDKDKDEDTDEDLMSKDENNDKDLKIGPRRSSRIRTFLEDNNTVNTGSQINAGSSRNTELSEYQPYTSYVIPQHLPQHKVLTQIAILTPRTFSRT